MNWKDILKDFLGSWNSEIWFQQCNRETEREHAHKAVCEGAWERVRVSKKAQKGESSRKEQARASEKEDEQAQKNTSACKSDRKSNSASKRGQAQGRKQAHESMWEKEILSKMFSDVSY